MSEEIINNILIKFHKYHKTRYPIGNAIRDIMKEIKKAKQQGRDEAYRSVKILHERGIDGLTKKGIYYSHDLQTIWKKWVYETYMKGKPFIKKGANAERDKWIQEIENIDKTSDTEREFVGRILFLKDHIKTIEKIKEGEK